MSIDPTNKKVHLRPTARAGAALLLSVPLAGCALLGGGERPMSAEANAQEQAQVCAQLTEAAASPATATALLKGEVVPVNPLSQNSPLRDWEHLSFFPFKLPTQYSVMQCGADNKRQLVRVDARSSASSMIRPLNLQAGPDSRIRWKWWIAKPNTKAKTLDRSLEDSPIRVVLAFEGDRSRLSEQDQQFLQRMDMLTRKPAPYATLMYSLGAGVAQYDVITSAHTHTVKIKAVQTQQDRNGLGQWRLFDRNIEEDFVKAFGEKPGRLLSVAIMGDADNTKASSRAYITDLELIGLKE